MSEITESKCVLCGLPMPPGEEMFVYHGYSGPCPGPPLPKETKESAETFLSRAVTTGGRVVSSNDLNEWQLSEARVLGNFWVSVEGFGWVILPWNLTTDKDRNRERSFFRSEIGKNAEFHNENE